MSSSSRLLTLCLFCAQGGKCFYCNSPFDGPEGSPKKLMPPNARKWTRDHLFPISRGGQRPGNIILACTECNINKGAHLPTTSQLSRAREIQKIAVMFWQQFLGSHTARATNSDWFKIFEEDESNTQSTNVVD